MRLIQLSANKPSFRTVRFNPKGPSFIIARQKNPESSDKKRTYNGVGKSLLVALVHFCFGSNNRNEFGTTLPGWEFSLTFEVGGKTYIVRRSTDKQDMIYLGDTKVTRTTFNETLGNLCFDIPDGGSFLTWRSLLPAFIRKNRASYVDSLLSG